jgi:DNA-binding transcriptional MerR regulator
MAVNPQRAAELAAALEREQVLPQRRLEKSASAFRTISEVAEELDVPQHVLRFWETKFPQVRPLKRGGGRRYYRPEDVDLLRAIRSLLYQEGYTIKGVQKLMREGALKARAQPPAEPEPIAPSAPAAEPMPSERDIKRRTQLDLAIDDLAELRNRLGRLLGL